MFILWDIIGCLWLDVGAVTVWVGVVSIFYKKTNKERKKIPIKYIYADVIEFLLQF